MCCKSKCVDGRLSLFVMVHCNVCTNVYFDFNGSLIICVVLVDQVSDFKPVVLHAKSFTSNADIQTLKLWKIRNSW